MNRADLLGVQPVWLVTITAGGHTWRASSEPCHPVDADGEAVPFDGGLADAEIEDVADALGLDPTPPSATISVLLPLDVAELVEAGLDLTSATCEVALWAPGLAYEDREIVVLGTIDEPAYGGEGEPMEFSVSPALETDTTLLLDPREVVNSETWPGCPTASIGQVYPRVDGRPGITWDASGIVSYYPSSPALMVLPGAGKLLVADRDVGASQVRIYDPDGGYDTLSVDVEVDGLGRTVSTVTPVVGGGTLDRGAQQFFVSWSSALGDRAIDTISMALEQEVSRSSVGLDRAQLAALAPLYSSWAIAGWTQDAEITVWEWATAHILPLIPCSVVLGPTGLRLLPWRWDASRDEALCHLVEGQGFTRTTLSTWSSRNDVANRRSLEYAPDADGDYQQTAIHGPDSDEGATSLHAAVSGARYGTRSSPAESSDYIADRATAALVLSWRTRLSSMPHREIEGEAGPDLLWLRPGDVVLYTDDDLHLSERVALVQSVTRRIEGPTLRLIIYTDPSRDPPGPTRAA